MDYDIIVSGGGIAGLTATAAFASAGFDVLCVDPAPPVTARDAIGADLRSTAFLQPARQLLDDIGLWARLAPHAAPLQIMRIIDAGGPEPEARMSKEFDASDISELPFGWNLPNWLLRREILAHLDSLPSVTFRAGVSARSLLTRTAEARVGLSDGSRLRCRLVVAADGRNSAMRQAAGIDVTTHRFGQKALAFAVTHTVPHDNISTEVHRTGGPFTLVPLPDHDGQPCSAVVWMCDGTEAQRLHQLPEAAFNDAATARSGDILGPLQLVSPRSVWPIISQIADRLTAQRTALVAEAAHVMPPIGAQGLNMSLADLDTLLDLAEAAPSDLGSPSMLDAYQDARHGDIRLRVKGIDALNRASIAGHPLAQHLRGIGIRALYDIAPIRRRVMAMGLGAGR